MPIFVQTPGGKLDTTGQGMAAAQQYRGNEQKMRLQEEGFKQEIGLAKRKLDIEEQDITFQREQLAQQQEAAADYIMAEKMKFGENVSPEQRRALRMLSPDAQERVLYGLAQQSRVRAEQQTFDTAMSKLEELEKTGNVTDEIGELRAQAEAGAITPRQFTSAVQALGKKSATIDHAAKTYEVVQGNMETWQADPTFDMPPEDDEAYDDVMDLYALLSPNSPFDPKVKYDQVWNQYKFLTTKGMREASRSLLEADMKKNGMTAVSVDELDALMESASKDPEFQKRAEGLYGGARAFADAAVPRFMRSRPGAQAQAAPASGGAPAAQTTAPAGSTPAPAPAEGGGVGENRSLGKIGRSLTPPADQLKPEEESIGMQALKNLGLKAVPDEGTPEFKALLREIKRLEDEAGGPPKSGYEKLQAVRDKVPSGKDVAEGILGVMNKAKDVDVSGFLDKISPSEAAKRRQMAENRRNRGVR